MLNYPKVSVFNNFQMQVPVLNTSFKMLNAFEYFNRLEMIQENMVRMI